jgi:hypothetical protein
MGYGYGLGNGRGLVGGPPKVGIGEGSGMWNSG